MLLWPDALVAVLGDDVYKKYRRRAPLCGIFETAD
jgi:hypothetical protein